VYRTGLDRFDCQSAIAVYQITLLGLANSVVALAHKGSYVKFASGPVPAPRPGHTAKGLWIGYPPQRYRLSQGGSLEPGASRWGNQPKR
jgi:hypothetical protein